MLMNKILAMPHNQIERLTGISEHESQFDFLSWLYDSLAEAEADEEIDVERLVSELAQEYEQPSEPNHYQEKLDAKRQRYGNLATKRQQDSDAEYEESRRMASAIPFGQPILVGHHSEGRDRRVRNRIHNKMGKSIQLANTAKYHAQRAARVGKAGISSDDPNKLIKLRRKLAEREELQTVIKETNKIVRSKKKGYTQEKKIGDLMALGIKKADAQALFIPDFGNRIGFPSYAVSNNNAEIRRIKQRIEIELENQEIAQRQKDREFRDSSGKKMALIYETLDNRIQLHFSEKPERATRDILKKHAYNYSSFNRAWQRKITANALNDVQYLIKDLQLEEILN